MPVARPDLRELQPRGRDWIQVPDLRPGELDQPPFLAVPKIPRARRLPPSDHLRKFTFLVTLKT